MIYIYNSLQKFAEKVVANLNTDRGSSYILLTNLIKFNL